MSFVRDGPLPLSGADLDSIAGDSGPARGLALDPTCSRAIPFKTHCLRTQRKKDGAARASFPYACRGHAQRSGQDGASGGGIRSRGERRGARPDSCRPACERFAGDREAGFRRARRTLRLAFGAAHRSPSVARGRRAPEGREGGALAPPFGRSRPPPSRTERGTGRRTHSAAPTRPPVCVSGSRSRPTLGGGLPARMPCDDCTGWMYWLRRRIQHDSRTSSTRLPSSTTRRRIQYTRRSRATSCRERAMGSVGSSAERRRPLLGPGLLCQPCGGHPLLVR